MSERQPVLFVGAGPGDPELITLKGQQALARADLILYTGSLIPPELLVHARPGAEVVDTASLDLENYSHAPDHRLPGRPAGGAAAHRRPQPVQHHS